MIVAKILDMSNDAANRNDSEKQRKHEKEMQDAKHKHEASENAKNRELEREKIEAKKNKHNPRPTDKPKVIENPREKADAKLPVRDKDNKHYMNPDDVTCRNLDGLDAHDPKVNPDLVRDYAKPEPNSEKSDKGNASDLYKTYINPADLVGYRLNEVITLEDFKIPEKGTADKCKVETRN